MVVVEGWVCWKGREKVTGKKRKKKSVEKDDRKIRVWNVEKEREKKRDREEKSGSERKSGKDKRRRENTG